MSKIIFKKVYIAIMLAVLLLAVMIYLYFKSNQSNTEAFAYPPVKVAVAMVESQSAPRSLSAVGELEAVRQIQVASEAAGRIDKIYFQSGQYVHAGQILLKL